MRFSRECLHINSKIWNKTINLMVCTCVPIASAAFYILNGENTTYFDYTFYFLHFALRRPSSSSSSSSKSLLFVEHGNAHLHIAYIFIHCIHNKITFVHSIGAIVVLFTAQSALLLLVVSCYTRMKLNRVDLGLFEW